MNKNVSNTERVASVALGAVGLLAAATLGRARSKALAAVGGTAALGLLARGTTGHCSVYDQLGINTREKAERDRTEVHSIRVNKPLTDCTAALVGGGLASPIAGRVEMLVDRAGKGTRLTLNAPDMSAAEKETELRNLKALLETGEIATTKGQTHGKRSALGATFRAADLKLEETHA